MESLGVPFLTALILVLGVLLTFDAARKVG